MTRRVLAGAVVALVLGVTLAAQTQNAKPYTPPKTVDGHPDLQGFWSSSTYVPLERPNGVMRRSSCRRSPRSGRAART